MYSIYALKEYAETGKNAKEALQCIEHATPSLSEELWYKLGELMKMDPAEANKRLQDDADDDIEFWFTIGEEEPAYGLRQPDVKWKETLKYPTRIEAEKARQVYQQKMKESYQFVYGIERISKSYDAAETELVNLDRRLFRLQQDLEYYPEEIERCLKKLEESKAKIPAAKQNLEDAKAKFVAKYGKLPWYLKD